MAKPRIALYLPNLDGGGAERMMATLACSFAEAGHPVDLVLVEAQGPYLNEVCDSVRIIDLKAKGVMTSVPRLVRYLWRNKPVALLVTLNHASIAALIARKLAFVPTRVVVRQANILRPIDPSTPAKSKPFALLGFLKRFRGRTLHWAIRNVFPQADALVGVSHGVSESIKDLIKVSPEKIHTIYNPVTNVQMLKKAQVPLEHPWFGVGQPPVLLGTGRLEAQKDFATLIRAFAKVRQVRVARLVILGEGGHRAALEQLAFELGIGDEVSLPGFVDNPFSYMARADTFVLSSLSEGLPGVLIQAMACGCKLVSTDCPSGPREILEGGKYGLLTPVGDAEALAQAMIETLDQDGSDQREARRKRAWDFSETKAIPAYLEVLLPK